MVYLFAASTIAMIIIGLVAILVKTNHLFLISLLVLLSICNTVSTIPVIIVTIVYSSDSTSLVEYDFYNDKINNPIPEFIDDGEINEWFKKRDDAKLRYLRSKALHDKILYFDEPSSTDL